MKYLLYFLIFLTFETQDELMIHDLLTRHKSKPTLVIDPVFAKSDYTPIDLSVNNTVLQQVDITSADDMEAYISEFIQSRGAKVAYGGYLEKRNLYKRSAYFNEQADPKDERNIHLGIDVWAAAGTTIHAAWDGEIHSFKNNTNHGDYGPCIILKHQIEATIFYTLYGHLSMESLLGKTVGQKITQGEVIAALGDSKVNGDYAPHLHFQVILDMEDNFGDYPGVCSENQLEFYKKNCPDPMISLGL